MLADLVARILLNPLELPIGVVILYMDIVPLSIFILKEESMLV